MQLISLLKGIFLKLFEMFNVVYELNQSFKASKMGWYNKGSRFPRLI